MTWYAARRVLPAMERGPAWAVLLFTRKVQFPTFTGNAFFTDQGKSASKSCCSSHTSKSNFISYISLRPSAFQPKETYIFTRNAKLYQPHTLCVFLSDVVVLVLSIEQFGKWLFCWVLEPASKISDESVCLIRLISCCELKLSKRDQKSTTAIFA